MTKVKCNLTPQATGLSFRLVQSKNDPDHAVVRWDDGPVGMTADEVLAGECGEPTQLDKAYRFLEEVLSNGPLPAKEVKELADKRGVSVRTLERAKADLRIESRQRRAGRKKCWEWSLPKADRRRP